MSDPHLIPHWDIYENIPLPCLIIRPDFSIAAVNHAYLVKNRCTRSDLLEQNFFELLHTNTTTADLIRASFNYVFETHSSNELQPLRFNIGPARLDQEMYWEIKNLPLQSMQQSQPLIAHFATPVSNTMQSCLAEDNYSDARIFTAIKNYGIFSLDVSGHITSWNKGAEHIKGYEANEILGRSMDIFYTPQDIAKGLPARNLALALLNDGLETEGWRLRKDGTAFYANILFTPLKNEQGKHYGFSKITRDITEERNNRERVNFLADISRNIEDPIISTDNNLVITRWNLAACRLFGWTEEEAIGRTTLEILRSQFSTTEREKILASLQKEGYWHGQVDYITKQGEGIICLCTVSHLRDGQEQITGNLILLKDITQRVAAETQLAKLNSNLEAEVAARTSQLIITEKKYEQLFENNPMPMWVIRQQDFKFLAVNKMAVLQYGFSREEFLGMTALEIRPDNEKENFLNAEHTPETTADNFDKGLWKHRKKNGDIIIVQIMSHELLFEGTAAKMILAHDVTAKVKAEELIAESEKRLSTTMNNMLEGIQVHAFDWRYIFVNDALISFDGSSREEMIGIRLMDRYPGIEQTDAFKAMNRVMQLRVPEQLETAFIFPDGRKADYQLSIEPVPEGILVLSIDITEQRRAQKEYAQVQENYRTIMERISDAFVAFDIDWNYEYVNKAASVILNKKPEELLGKNVWKEFPESVNHNLFKAFHHSFNKQEYVQLEEFYAPFDMWMEFNIYPSPQGVTVFFSNINTRKKAEQLLVQSEANLKAIFDNTSEGFILTDKQGKIKAFNYRVTEFIMPGIGEMQIGSDIFQLTEESRLDFFRHVFDRVLAGESLQYDRPFSATNGRQLWINLSFNPVLDEGEMAGVCITAKDITDRRQAENELQKSYFEKRALAEKLSAILNTLPANIALVDPSGRIVEVNDSWKNFATENHYQGSNYGLGENYLEVSRKAGGKEKADGLHVAEGLSRVLEEQEQEFVYEYPCDSPVDNRWFRMIVSSLQKKEYAGAVIMHLEISELRRLEAERMQLQKDEQKKVTQAILQGQEKERNRIGRELHDNINQILAGTKLYLSVAANKDEQLRESVRYPIQLLDQSIEEIRKLCASMVTPLEDVQLEALIKDLLGKLNSGGIETTFNYAVQADRLSDELKLNVYRIVQELSNNIIKYSGALLVTIDLVLHQNELLLVVTDNGRGFSLGAKKSGIGLSNMRSRVQSFDGTIVIKSSEGAGTTTTIKIPVK